jgi:hypothetical protein
VVAFTVNVLAIPGPHELLAVTEIIPPALPATAIIDAEAELPLHPDGKVHSYSVASGTPAML